MAEVYIKLYAVENTLRNCIITVLSSKYGEDWWNKAVPPEIQKRSNRNLNDTRRDFYKISTQKPIYYTNISDLKKIIDINWQEFKSILKNKDLFRGRLTELEVPRNAISHSHLLPENERGRFSENVDSILEILSRLNVIK